MLDEIDTTDLGRRQRRVYIFFSFSCYLISISSNSIKKKKREKKLLGIAKIVLFNFVFFSSGFLSFPSVNVCDICPSKNSQPQRVNRKK